jgi:hypothetical protein
VNKNKEQATFSDGEKYRKSEKRLNYIKTIIATNMALLKWGINVTGNKSGLTSKS